MKPDVPTRKAAQMLLYDMASSAGNALTRELCFAVNCVFDHINDCRLAQCEACSLVNRVLTKFVNNARLEKKSPRGPENVRENVEGLKP